MLKIFQNKKAAVVFKVISTVFLLCGFVTFLGYHFRIELLQPLVAMTDSQALDGQLLALNVMFLAIIFECGSRIIKLKIGEDIEEEYRSLRQ